MSALEHGELLPEGENLQTKIVACSNEREHVAEEREHEISSIVRKPSK